MGIWACTAVSRIMRSCMVVDMPAMMLEAGASFNSVDVY